MRNVNSSFTEQINRLDDIRNTDSLGFSPNLYSNNAPIYNTIDTALQVSPVLSWEQSSFTVNEGDIGQILEQRIINLATSKINRLIVNSNYGNLSTDLLDPSYIYIYRASVYCPTNKIVDLKPSFNGRISAYVDGALVNNSMLSSSVSSFQMYLQAGWSEIVFVLKSNDLTYFNLGVELGKIVNGWTYGGKPNFNISNPECSVTYDNDLSDKRATNTANIQWYIQDKLSSASVNLYRRGPYSPLLEAPVITAGSGVLVGGSGVLCAMAYRVGDNIDYYRATVPAYYSVSAIYDSFESVPSEPFRINPGVILSGTEYVAITGIYDITGTLSGTYAYAIVPVLDFGAVNMQIGDAIASGAASISFNVNENINLYNIYRVDISSFGYNTFTDPGDIFITGIDTSAITGVYTFIDSGVTTTYSSGIVFVPSLTVGLNSVETSRSCYSKNGFQFEWDFDESQVADPSRLRYRIYRTFIDGKWESEDFKLGSTSNKSYTDSGLEIIDDVTPKNIPIIFKKIANLSADDTDYCDVGLKSNCAYDYAITTVGTKGEESAINTWTTYVVGDVIPPVAPSGITVTGVESSLNFTWINGGEQDYYATNIYSSVTDTGVYSLSMRANGQFASIPIGYNTVKYFKLTNVDLNDNESDFSDIVSGVTGAGGGTGGSTSGFVSGVGPSMDSAVMLWDGTGANKAKNSDVGYYGGAFVKTSPGQLTFVSSSGSAVVTSIGGSTVLTSDTSVSMSGPSASINGSNQVSIYGNITQILESGGSYPSNKITTFEPSGVTFFRDIYVNSGIYPSGNNVLDFGNAANNWRDAYISNLTGVATIYGDSGAFIITDSSPSQLDFRNALGFNHLNINSNALYLNGGDSSGKIGPYGAGDSGVIHLQSHMAPHISGATSLGKNNRPFATGWFKNAYISNLYGYSPITLHDDIVLSNSGSKSIGTNSTPLSGVWANNLNGVSIPISGYVPFGTSLLLNQTSAQTIVSGIPNFSAGLATIAITNNGESNKIDMLPAPIVPILSNLVPIMTSNTAPNGVCSASTVISSPLYDPWKAFDHDFTTNNRVWAASALTGWLQYQFTSAKTIYSYTVTAEVGTPGRAPKNFTLRGSANGSSWTILDTRTGETAWSSGETRSFTIASPAAYAYYRLDVSLNDGTYPLTIEELELFGNAGAGVPDIAFLTNGIERARFEQSGNLDIYTPIISNTTISGTNLYGSHIVAQRLVSGVNYSALITDCYINVDTTGGSRQITLPTASGNSGKSYYIRKISPDGYDVVVSGVLGQTINGSATKEIKYQHNSMMVVSDNTNWGIN